MSTSTNITFHSADRISISSDSNRFVAIIDLKGFSWSKFPPIATIKDILRILKYSYPSRLERILILNAGGAFRILWSLLKPLMPKKALGKVLVLDQKHALSHVDEYLGLENVEKSYGGLQEELDMTNSDVRKQYANSGYWSTHQ